MYGSYLTSDFSLVECLKLTYLDVSHNSLQKFPFNLSSLPMLKQVNVESNEGLLEIPDILGAMVALEKCNLSKCGLSELLMNFSKNNLHLININLSQNNLRGLPEGFQKLKQTLFVADVSANALQSIPDRLYVCSAMQELNLSRNNISVVPQDGLAVMQGLTINNCVI